MPRPQPQTYDFLPQVSELLQAEGSFDKASQISEYLGAIGQFGGLVVAHGEQLDLDMDNPLESPDPAPDGFWWRVVLMPQVNGFGSPPQKPYPVRPFPFRVRVDAVPTEAILEFGIDELLQKLHDIVFNILHLTKLANIEQASTKNEPQRGSFSTPTFRDESGGFRYSAADYFAILEP